MLDRSLEIEDEELPLTEYHGLRFRLVASSSAGVLSDDTVVVNFDKINGEIPPESLMRTASEPTEDTNEAHDDSDFLLPEEPVLLDDQPLDHPSSNITGFLHPAVESDYHYMADDHDEDSIPDLEDSAYVFKETPHVLRPNVTIVPDLRGTLSVRITWLQVDESMDVRYYVVHWVRNHCNHVSMYPHCNLPADHYQSARLVAKKLNEVSKKLLIIFWRVQVDYHGMILYLFSLSIISPTSPTIPTSL